MTFLDTGFLIFLAVAVLGFYICPVRYRWIELLIVSIVFYAMASVKYLPFIVFTSFTIYLVGRKMGTIYEQLEIDIKQEDVDRKVAKELKKTAKNNCKKYMMIGLIINLIVLIVVKFTKFAVTPINDILVSLGRDGNFDVSMIIVPLGISYYTFSCVSYLLDVYWKRVDYERNYARFLLYAIYFPHILQGPIERYGRLGQRLKGEFRFDYDRVCKGLQLMIWGYFKKLVIAERINLFTTGVYAEGSTAEGVIYILSFILDVVYIYADFSGCMDIARGVSQIFGIELDLNFNHPFASKSITEFWRRWHMSLGGWFREYVYYPISTSNMTKNISRSCKKHFSDGVTRVMVTVIPVFVTWFLTGLWHGTGITYVCWGIYYAIMIFISVSFEEQFKNLAVKLHINTEAKSWEIFQMLRTTLIFAGGRVLTRPGTLQLTKHAVKSALTVYNPWVLVDGTLYGYGLDQKNFSLMMISILLFGVVSHYQQKGSVRDMIAEQNLAFRWMIYVAAVAAVIVFGIYGTGYNAASFVYMAY